MGDREATILSFLTGTVSDKDMWHGVCGKGPRQGCDVKLSALVMIANGILWRRVRFIACRICDKSCRCA